MVRTHEPRVNGAGGGSPVPNVTQEALDLLASYIVAAILDRLPALIAAESDRLAYDLDQLSKATTLSRRTLEGYVADGTLSATRVGRRLIVFPESARAFLRSFHRSRRGVA